MASRGKDIVKDTYLSPKGRPFQVWATDLENDQYYLKFQDDKQPQRIYITWQQLTECQVLPNTMTTPTDHSTK